MPSLRGYEGVACFPAELHRQTRVWRGAGSSVLRHRDAHSCFPQASDPARFLIACSAVAASVGVGAAKSRLLFAHSASPNRGCTVTQRRVRSYARWRATGGTQRSCFSSNQEELGALELAPARSRERQRRGARCRHESRDRQAPQRHQRRTRVHAEAQLRAERQPLPETPRRRASRDWRRGGVRRHTGRDSLSLFRTDITSVVPWLL